MRNIRNRNGGRATLGLIFLVIGVVLMIKNLKIYFFPEWVFDWPLVMILIGIYSGIRCRFRNNGWIILIGMGLFFMADEYYPGLTDEPYFWPAAIILVGLIFLLRPGRSKMRDIPNDINAPDTTNDTGFMNIPATPDSDQYLHISSIFSGVNRIVLSKEFAGGDITCIFGGAEVDLTQADFTGRVTIRIDEVFGGIKLRLPPHWVVENRISGVFHGIEDRRNKNMTVTPDPTKVLVLQGSCVFAGIDLKSH